MLTARPGVLNSVPAECDTPAVQLSRRILAAARELEPGGECGGLARLAGQLHAVDPTKIDGDEARIAFWANLYNALVLQCLCLDPIRGNLLWHLRRFDRVAYRVGDHPYPLNVIENGVLRGNRRAPLRSRRPLRRRDPRIAAAPARVDPRIHFALNCGAVSGPSIHTYDPDSLDTQLEAATSAYLAAEVDIDSERCRVRLPRLMRLYHADFGNRTAQLRFAAARMPGLERCMREHPRPPRVSYGRFDWTVAPRAAA
jgi:Protein of unknown function, DUF547